MKTYRKKETVQAEPMTLKKYVELFPRSPYKPNIDELGYYVIDNDGFGDWWSKEAFENDFKEV